MAICPSIIKSQNNKLETDTIPPQADWASAKSGREANKWYKDK